ncbi:MAG: MFS transporter [Anaerolineae bacterium]|nr:MFS transporter [Anaerolineae bacterium]
MTEPSALSKAVSPQQPVVLRALRRALFWVSLPFFILSLLLPVYGREIGADVVQIGLAFSAFSFMTVLLRPLVGWGLDRYGRRRFLLFGLAGYALTMGAFAAIDQVWGILLARVLQGIASSFLWLAARTITADVSTVDTRGVAFGGIAQASSQGSIAGTFIGFALLNAQIGLGGGRNRLGTWPVLFGVYALASLAALVVAWQGVPETYVRQRERASRPIVWSRAWILLLLVTLVTGASAAMISPILIVFLQDRLNVPIDVLSWAFLPSGLVWAILPRYLGRLADRFGRKPLMILGLAAAAITSFVIPHLASMVALAALWAWQALCYAAGDPAEQALVADLTGNDQRGRAYGVYAFAANVGATIGPLGGAWLYQHQGVQWPFYANGVVLALCGVVLWIWLRVPDRAER